MQAEPSQYQDAGAVLSKGGLLHSTEAACRNSLHFHQRGSGKAADLSCASRPSHATATHTAAHELASRTPRRPRKAKQRQTLLQPKHSTHRGVPLHTLFRPPAARRRHSRSARRSDHFRRATTTGAKKMPVTAGTLCQAIGMPCSSTLTRALLSAVPMAHSVRLQNDERSALN